MVRGIEHFKESLRGFEDEYVLIGGAACSMWYSEHVPEFRATNDLDVVLILEHLSARFVVSLKEYLTACGYQQWERHDLHQDGISGKVMYRFVKPANPMAPAQIELLSRKGNVPTLDVHCSVAPVVGSEGYTGLSCIVLDDDYYHFLMKEIRKHASLPLLSVPALIVLKIKAHLNLLENYDSDAEHGSDAGMVNVRKHRNDVFFMLMSLDDVTPRVLPHPLRRDVEYFVHLYAETSPEWDGILSHLKSKYGKVIMRSTSPSVLLSQLKELFLESDIPNA